LTNTQRSRNSVCPWLFALQETGREILFATLREDALQRDNNSETISKTDRRLGVMRGSIHPGEHREVICWRVIDQPPILSAHEEAMRKIEVSTGAIDKCGARLRVSTGEIGFNVGRLPRPATPICGV
jgi:hypothetical protein